jgi:hypothetical protein
VAGGAGGIRRQRDGPLPPRTAPRSKRMMKVVAMDIAAPDRVASVRSVGSFL